MYSIIISLTKYPVNPLKKIKKNLHELKTRQKTNPIFKLTEKEVPNFVTKTRKLIYSDSRSISYGSSLKNSGRKS